MEDAQNMASVLQFFRMMTRHKSDNASKLKNPRPMSQSKLLEFNILTEICECYLFLLTGKQGSVHNHLVNLAYLAHLIFPIYRKQVTFFFPAQTYQDTQTMIKSIFKSVIQSQVVGIKRELLLLGIFLTLMIARLGVLFGVLRTMIGSQSGFDIAMLAGKFTAAYEVTEVLCRRPGWQVSSRRLNGNITDHVHPGSWTDSTDVAGVNAPDCWVAGASKAKAYLAATGLLSGASLSFSYIEKADSRVTMQYLATWVSVWMKQ
jgi:hypothetical protein